MSRRLEGGGALASAVLLFELLLGLLLLTGCWNRRELNELAIAAAMGMDKAADGYRISIQIINPGEIAAKKGGGMMSPVVTYAASGHTVMDALRKMSTEMPREIYLAHLRILVIGESLARQGIGKVLDVLSRYHEVRTDFHIVAARDRTAEEVLSSLTALEKIPANRLYTSLDLSEKIWATTGKTNLDTLISAIGSEGQGAVMTGIEIVGDPENGRTVEQLKRTTPSPLLRFSGLGVMRQDKLEGWLGERESKGLGYTRGNLAGAPISFPCPRGGYIGVELIRMKSDVRGEVKAGKPVGSVRIRAEGNLSEVECETDVLKLGSISELEKETENEIRTSVLEAVRRVQREYRSDIFGFGEALHRAKPAAWKKWKRDWPRMFAGLEVKVNVDVKIRRIGTVGDPVVQKLEE
ncbi:Ger(x)C family spore germination protein [Cohnella sp. CFH 77786]|uniref:Ger(x)C family spore germination protein n=1 Tax=Cohnella sp. CFH 77786 TaxID=2662265 RepID=UPI001C60BBD2|nr:Ger(x)C family spore germination protein [Cohnella sp. CFH 77786]MBW5446361.1 Ger(x)C family spore germination protein [Cohnella sp. CFH 77786]